MKKDWPERWGKFNEYSIGIMTPYPDQVYRIRIELKKRKILGISVERVLNVQGKNKNHAMQINLVLVFFVGKILNKTGPFVL